MLFKLANVRPHLPTRSVSCTRFGGGTIERGSMGIFVQPHRLVRRDDERAVGELLAEPVTAVYIGEKS